MHNNYRDRSDVENNFGVDAVKFDLFAKVIGGLLGSFEGKLMVSRDQALLSCCRAVQTTKQLAQ